MTVHEFKQRVHTIGVLTKIGALSESDRDEMYRELLDEATRSGLADTQLSKPVES